jgi:hypothetical protein
MAGPYSRLTVMAGLEPAILFVLRPRIASPIARK